MSNVIYGNLSPSGRLAAPAVGHVEELIDQRAATVVAAGRPDIAATTPYTSAQLAAMPSGTVYRSTDGPQGAWAWQKQGAIWAVTVGDTGWRDISDLLVNGWTASTALHVRRINERIYMFGRVNGSAATGNTVLTLPTGFASYRPGNATIRPDGFVISTAVVSSTERLSNMYVDFAFTAYQAWPTTLPGTAI